MKRVNFSVLKIVVCFGIFKFRLIFFYLKISNFDIFKCLNCRIFVISKFQTITLFGNSKIFNYQILVIFVFNFGNFKKFSRLKFLKLLRFTDILYFMNKRKRLNSPVGFISYVYIEVMRGFQMGRKKIARGWEPPAARNSSLAGADALKYFTEAPTVVCIRVRNWTKEICALPLWDLKWNFYSDHRCFLRACTVNIYTHLDVYYI